MALRPPNNQCLVFRGIVNGWRWRVFPDNFGDHIKIQGYDAVPIQADELTPLSLLTLVNDQRTTSYRFQVDDTNTADPRLQLLQVADPASGRAFVTCFSPNGREWEVTVKQDGIPLFTSIGIDWPRITTTPSLVAPNNVPWTFSVDDGGLYSVTPNPLPVRTTQIVLLRASDDSASFNVTVDNTGLLTVGDPGDVALADVYDVELVSPGGFSYNLWIDAGGIIQIGTDLQDARNQRDEWVVFLAKNNSLLYVVDERFRPPHRRLSSSYGQRMRRYY
jgi:hypothetical protein